MRYTIVDIEVTESLPALHVSGGDAGIALVLRRKGRPIGFVMKSMPSMSTLSREALARIISREIGLKLLQENIRDELACSKDESPFPSLTTAVCTKDRPENVTRCLKHLLKLSIPKGLSRFEVLVVDNAPADERTRKLVGAISGVRYAREPRPGLDLPATARSESHTVICWLISMTMSL